MIPAFIADMDFKVAPAVQDAVKHLTDTEDYGYGQPTDAIPLFGAFSDWMARRHQWRPDPALTHANTNVVQGLVATWTCQRAELLSSTSSSMRRSL